MNSKTKKPALVSKDALEEEVYEIKRKVTFIRKHVLEEVYKYRKIEAKNIRDGSVNMGYG